MTRILSRLTNVLFFLILLGTCVFWFGCATPFPRHTEPNQAYLQGLQTTSDSVVPEANEAAALERLMALFEDFRTENLRANTRKVYAGTFFFRDGFKELHAIDELEAYFLHSAEPVRNCRFDFSKPVKDGNDYFLRWTMSVNLKRDNEDQIDRVLGLSHIRFNENGKVVFHQDYWDPTDLLYRRIPIANRLIGYVRSKL